ncbi:hypothetical protein A3709_20475 [Halioglobus sp. HI00S01]|uniref:hypothetical protein n=1 Tax=Halioglobus sp. HI00S01 TaxID=1822214 RepID=UPI0007C3EA37|nr:hypothetical protein [Halioglobus sp. HI00S01]KZX57989.1 hypothetical protein A3709_20475 [Halioglobus sp. HI00S01]
MNFLYSLIQTIALILLSFIAFAAAVFILPFLRSGGDEGALMQIWNLGMANAAFYGLPYWHLTQLKADSFLPRANSYALVWIYAILAVFTLPLVFLVEFEWLELLYSLAQCAISCVVLFYSYRFKHHSPEVSP